MNTYDPESYRAESERRIVNEGVDYINRMRGIYSCEIEWNDNQVDYVISTKVPDPENVNGAIVVMHFDIDKAHHFAYEFARPVGHDCHCEPCWIEMTQV